MRISDWSSDVCSSDLYSTGAADRLGHVLADHGISAPQMVERAADLDGLPKSVAAIAVLPIEHGFEAADLCVVAEQDILGDRLVRPRQKKRRAENFIAEASALQPGDFVVHIDPRSDTRRVGKECVSKC